MLRSPLGLAMVCAAACSFQFTQEQGLDADVPLLGPVPAGASFPRLNRAPVQSWHWASLSPRSTWIILCESQLAQRDPTACQQGALRLRQVQGGEAEVVLAAPRIEQQRTSASLFYRAITYDTARATTVLAAHSLAGLIQQAAAIRYELPGGGSVVGSSYTGRAFLYWAPEAPGGRLELLLHERPWRRTLAAPAGFSGSQDALFTRNGTHLFLRDGADQIRVYGTEDPGKDLDLGRRSPWVGLTEEDEPRLVTCGEDGLRLVRFETGRFEETVLDLAPPCRPSSVRMIDAYVILYEEGSAHWSIPLDGTAAFFSAASRSTQPVPAGWRVLHQEWLSRRFLYSTDPAGRYIHDAGDGWLDGWRFMERGLLPQLAVFSLDGGRLRWLEHAANFWGVGELRSARLPRGPALRLARNVRQHIEELPDGRILAVANHATPGAHTRLLLIDEEARTARGLVSGVKDFRLVGEANEVLVELYAESGVDLIHVGLPPRSGERP